MEDEIKKSKPDKSPSDEGVTNRMMRAGEVHFNALLHDAFNTEWELEVQLKAWQYSLLQPIHKGGTKPKPDPASCMASSYVARCLNFLRVLL